jgi:hypothetical protein
VEDLLVAAAALRAAIQAVESTCSDYLAQFPQADFREVGLIVLIRDALAAAGVDREDTEQPQTHCPDCGAFLIGKPRMCAEHGEPNPDVKRQQWRDAMAAGEPFKNLRPVGDTGQADEPQRRTPFMQGYMHVAVPVPPMQRPARTTPIGDARASGGSFGSWLADQSRRAADAKFGAGQVVPQQPPAQRWAVDLTCCGEDAGVQITDSWDQAQAFRESYLDVEGHERTAVIHHAIDAARIGYHDPAPFVGDFPCAKRYEHGEHWWGGRQRPTSYHCPGVPGPVGQDTTGGDK